MAAYLHSNMQVSLWGKKQMFISVSHSNSDWKSIRASLRKICKVPRFFIMAPRQRRQHLHLSAPTFCTHYIWIKVMEWIDPSALASGHASKRRSTRRLFCLCPPNGESRRWWTERLSPLIIRDVPLDRWRKRSARCVHPHRAPTDRRRRRLVTLRSASFRPLSASHSQIEHDAPALGLMGTMGGTFQWKYGALSKYWIFAVCDLCRSALWGIASSGQLIRKGDVFWTYFIRQVLRSIHV